jgi:serine phosphatase RsbU (regulator of sigma subunit)
MVMDSTSFLVGDSPDRLAGELRNFEEIARGIMPRPGSIPSLQGIDVYGELSPLNGVIGGDHLIYMDFKKRYDLDARIEVARTANRPDIVENLERSRRMAGITLIDVSGHQLTDAMLAAMFHQAFLTGALYELDMCGQITRRLFENLNARFNRSSRVNKFITTLYGEIDEDARFRFLSAASPAPVVFSIEHDRFMELGQDYTSFPPLGTFPSRSVDQKLSKGVLGFKDKYRVNEWTLMGAGDILLFYTDGLAEHTDGHSPYHPVRFEEAVRRAKHLSAADIVHTVLDDVRAFANPTDDVSLVAIKRV